MLPDRLATPSNAKELATELATSFPINPPNYDPSQFSGLTYEELAAKLAALQPPDIPKKKAKKKNIITLITIDPLPKRRKLKPLPHLQVKMKNKKKRPRKKKRKNKLLKLIVKKDWKIDWRSSFSPSQSEEKKEMSIEEQKNEEEKEGEEEGKDEE